MENDGLRERILRASISLIEQEGLASLSLREVARRAGVSHQAPYHYFADRESILAALAERGFAMLRATMEEARSPGIGPTEAIERAAIAYVQFACNYPAHFRIMFRPELIGIRDHPRPIARDAFRHVPEMVLECMKAGFPQSAGVDVTATLFWSIAHGLACLLLDGRLVMGVPDFWTDPKQAVAQVARLLRQMVEATISQGLVKCVTTDPAERKRSTK